MRQKLHGGLVGSLDDLDKLLGNQRRAADQTAVDVGLCQQLEGVLVVHEPPYRMEIARAFLEEYSLRTTVRMFSQTSSA